MKTWRFPFEKSPESGKKGLQNRVAHDIIPRVSTIRRTDIGMSPSGKAPDFDSGISSVQIRPSQPYDPLAQQAEQLPFKQWVRGSNPRRVTRKLPHHQVGEFSAVGDSNPFPCGCPVDIHTRQFKNWRAPKINRIPGKATNCYLWGCPHRQYEPSPGW